MKIFIAHSINDGDLVEAVVTILREEDHEVLVPIEMKFGDSIFAEISAGIRSADVLFAVVTSGNANIYYELGLAAGASVPTLIAARTGDSLPADLASVPYVQISGDISKDARVITRRILNLEGLASAKAPKFHSAEAALQAAVKDPALLESIRPLDFEKLIAELFKERGYEVQVDRSTRDTGIDFAIRSSDKRDLVLVEVKKLSRQSRVSVESVRKLLNVVSGWGATVGILVAPAGFTAAALALAAGTPLLLLTLEEILSAKTEKELLKNKRIGG